MSHLPAAGASDGARHSATAVLISARVTHLLLVTSRRELGVARGRRASHPSLQFIFSLLHTELELTNQLSKHHIER